MSLDAYRTLGVDPQVSDQELRSSYRRLVKLYHPDHNAGSQQAATRFAAVQVAYDTIVRARAAGRQPPPSAINARLDAMEREVAQAAKAKQRKAPGGAAPGGGRNYVTEPPSREALGYYDTDDSFTAIIDDAIDEATQRLQHSDAKRRFTRRLTDLFGSD